MIAGFRDLVPELRPTASLDFDIMPMPTVDDPATVGDLTGICISHDTPDVAESADFLVDFISTESVSAVAAAGYLAPANTTVALSDAFLQPGRLAGARRRLQQQHQEHADPAAASATSPSSRRRSPSRSRRCSRSRSPTSTR